MKESAEAKAAEAKAAVAATEEEPNSIMLNSFYFAWKYKWIHECFYYIHQRIRFMYRFLRHSRERARVWVCTVMRSHTWKIEYIEDMYGNVWSIIWMISTLTHLIELIGVISVLFRRPHRLPLLWHISAPIATVAIECRAHRKKKHF